MKTIDLFNGFPWPRKSLRFLCSQLDGLEARICELESAHAADAVDRDTEVEQELGKELRDAIMESTRFAAELRDANGVIARQNESIAKLRRTNARADEWEESAKRELQDAHERIGALEGDLARANATIGHLEETARLLTEQRDEARMRFILNLTPSATPDNLSTERAPASAEEPQPGLYRHWKGKRYYVACVVTHTESNERLVVYVSHESPTTWARPLRSWNAPVRRPDGSIRPRFVRDEAQKFIHQEPKETESTEEPILGATYVNWVGGKCKVECIARRSDAIALLGGWERVVVYRYRKTDDPIVCALSFWNEIVDRSDGTRGPRFVREP